MLKPICHALARPSHSKPAAENYLKEFDLKIISEPGTTQLCGFLYVETS